MSTNGVNACEDAEMAECDGDKVVTMMDVLEEQENFEEDANAVLGASDDKNCTYSKGYIKRQAIYACMTCCADAKEDPTKRAGVCLACSLNCHENHDLVELYTKRNFRCDCGNPKFNSNPCQFTPNKTILNEENIYNQNFSGLYCTCHRPYPDPDCTTEQEMIQCIICEDWLHSSHLEVVVPPSEQYAEMICKACMDKNEFLHDYSNLAINTDSGDVDILNTSSEIVEMTKCNGITDEDMKGNEKIESMNSDDTVNEPNTVSKTVAESESSTEEAKEPIETNTELQNALSDDQAIPQQETSTETSESAGVVSEKQDTENNDSTQSETTVPEAPTDKPDDITSVTEPESKEEESKTPSETTHDDNNTKMEQKEQELTEDFKTPTETSEEKNENKDEIQSSVNNETVTTIESTETPDNRSKEEVEEDLLLADPVDNVPVEINNKDTTSIAADTNASEEVIENPDKSESPAMDTTESEGTTENKEENQEDKVIPNSSTELTTDPEQIQTGECEKTIPNEKEEEKCSDIVMNGSNEDQNTNDTTDKSNNEVTDEIVTGAEKRKLSSEAENEQSEVKKPKLDGNEEIQCVRPRGVKKTHKGATFWPSSFRHKLCTCNVCISMYKDLSVLFLTDPNDTVTAYERLGKERTDGKPVSQYEKGMAALSSLGHVQQINALTEYAKMRDKLLDFLKSFKDRKVIVKEEDIRAFFAGMKPVREPDGVYFCR